MSPSEIESAVKRVRQFGRSHSDRTLFVIRQKTSFKLYLAGKFPRGPKRCLSVVWSNAATPPFPRKFSLPADAALTFYALREPPYNPERYEMEEHLVLPDGGIDLVNHRTLIRSLPIPAREPEVKNYVHIERTPGIPWGDEPGTPEEVPAERALQGVPDGEGGEPPHAGAAEG